MKTREYEITIAPDGTVELDVHGHKGKSCFDIAKIFSEVVGECRSHQLKSDYYEPEEQVQFRIEQSH